MKTYTARLEQEHDGRWSVELEEEPRVHTWGKTVDQALNRMREAAALWYRTDEASIELADEAVRGDHPWALQLGHRPPSRLPGHIGPRP